MKPVHPKLPVFLLLLLVGLGTGAFSIAFWLADHRLAIPAPDVALAVSLVVFFVSYTWAFLLLLRWRDSRNAARKGTLSSTVSPQPRLEGTIYGLIPGGRYQIIKPFTDYYRNSFEQNEILRFKERHFLPYEGGHTIMFDERPMYLQEEINREIIDNFQKYVVKIPE